MLPLCLAQTRFLSYTCGEKGRTLRFFANATIRKTSLAPPTKQPTRNDEAQTP